ncbi:hypothetical protein KUTeg_024481 [Tegillarca granosa]|uniref:SGNH hydrolase-type esterase domain-containing protein n=1 Tax=Tegillarca granosa TaxID=220873 RepID=A0ABQ9DYH6_TEGGR|nr:hypothetical protein KUTeg_024481 [Tegillarca granosa]
MKSKVLISGHSQAKYFSHHLKRTDVDVVSFSGFRIEQMWEKIHTMVPFYTMIVLHIGANNLWNDSVSKVLRQYQNLVQNIWTVNATCRVVISGLLPRGQNRFQGKAKSVKFLSMVNRKALAVNKKLHLISQSYQRLSYVGHPDFMVNGQLQPMLSRDGLHLNWNGTANIVAKIEMEIHRLRFSSFETATKLRNTEFVARSPIAQLECLIPSKPEIPTTYRDVLLKNLFHTNISFMGDKKTNTPVSSIFCDVMLNDSNKTVPTPYRDALMRNLTLPHTCMPSAKKINTAQVKGVPDSTCDNTFGTCGVSNNTTQDLPVP